MKEAPRLGSPAVEKPSEAEEYYLYVGRLSKEKEIKEIRKSTDQIYQKKYTVEKNYKLLEKIYKASVETYFPEKD